MSHWLTLIEIVQKICGENPEIEEILNETERLHKEKQLLQNELKESERENTRLQIELFNVKAMIEPPNHNPNEAPCEQTYSQLTTNCVALRFNIMQIDFMKILQCNHMQMEQNFRHEMQQIHDMTMSLSPLYEQMEQRDVVQRYRTAQLAYKESKEELEKVQSSLEKCTREGLKRLNNAKEKSNKLIVSLVQSCKNLNDLKQKFQQLKKYEEKLKNLQQKKLELMSKLENAKINNFGVLMPCKSTTRNSTSSLPSPYLQTFKNDNPKLPTFAEIMNSINTDLTKFEMESEITVIENTTNIMVKSILRNSQDSLMEINQSFTTKHTKHVQFKKPLEEKFEYNGATDTTVSDSSSDETHIDVVMPQLNQLFKELGEIELETDIYQISSDDESAKDEGATNVTVTKQKKNIVENMASKSPIQPTHSQGDDKSEEMSPSNDNNKTKEVAPVLKDTENLSSNKPKLDILECVVLKPSSQFAYNEAADASKENVLKELDYKIDEDKTKHSSDEEIMSPPTIQDGESFAQSFYQELLSPSQIELSEPESDTSSTSKDVFKDFSSYLNAVKIETTNTENNVSRNKNRPNSSLNFASNGDDKNPSSNNDFLDFMNFDTTTSFNLTSNDEDEKGGGAMDFLFS
ncbi:extracellular matrix-binding protein ebh [Stomoxys calcitrans]|uniref:extracellular matrix-binding protein ebh n=1 Tax=Stomoxys calcitrans TaxID=35570 RepID=UPI0027E30CE7|nr:extracellular matrix-binding protein ebh [Stomoxys calcitrans]